MAAQFVLSIDQGTTGTTVNLIDSKGASVGRHNEEHPQIFPQAGWVEHDPEAIWKSVEVSLTKVLQQAKGRFGIHHFDKESIAAIGITNQRETVVMWERATGRPLYNAIVWQCRRTADLCLKLKKAGKEKIFKKKTGLVLDPYFSGTKIQWLLDHVPEARTRARRGEICVGTIDTYLLWRLTGGKVFATDVSNASRTLLMNLQTAEWDSQLLDILRIPENILPEIRSSSEVYGAAEEIRVAGTNVLAAGVPVASLIGDQQSALFGQAAFDAGEAKCTYGTGSFILMNTGKKVVASNAGCLTTVAWKLGPKAPLVYALEGGAFICGAAVQWLRDGLKIIAKSAEVEELARSVASCEGVQFVPALTGLGAPHWNAEARGVIVGLTRGSTKAHIARATLEAMALQNVEILHAMEKDLRKKIRTLCVDGGASANNLLMQMQADFLGCEISRPKMLETTSAGAAYLAGLAVGFWKNLDELRSVATTDSRFQPQMTTKDRSARLNEWATAVAKA